MDTSERVFGWFLFEVFEQASRPAVIMVALIQSLAHVICTDVLRLHDKHCLRGSRRLCEVDCVL